MISSQRTIEIMDQSIEIAKSSVVEKGKINPFVGAVLVNDNGNELLTCYRGETGRGNHCEYGLLKKAQKYNIDTNGTILFVTLEPCVSRGPGKTPCAQRIVNAGIKEVYIGTLDPNPAISGRGELFLRSSNIIVNRYPHELNLKLMELNKEFFNEYKQSFAPNNSLFVQKKIPNIMSEYLRKNNYDIPNLPLNWDVDLKYVQAKYSMHTDDLELRESLLNKAMGYAYDKKYLKYVYAGDVRGLFPQWKSSFRDILSDFSISLKSLRTLVVGCGNGNEGELLYPDADNLTLVDIAPDSLGEAKKRLNPKHAYVLNANKLSCLADNSFDIYISLMTYQSTYFDIKGSLTEAYRVLSDVGIIIISVAKGFMKNETDYIEGLIDPSTDEIRPNRPFDIVDRIRVIMQSYGMNSLGIKTTPSEIFIYARKNHTR